MYGAILGDIIGSPYEFSKLKKKKAKDFPLFSRFSRFTDDSVMTMAVAEALMIAVDEGVISSSGADISAENAVKELLVDSLKKWGRTYPNAGYGGRFFNWLFSEDREPYYSYGNGSAMRVSSAGWLFEDLDTTRLVARWTAEVTHDHPEGIKGAESTAACIYLARTGHDKAYIKKYVVREFGYDLERTCDGIRPGYYFDVSCQGSVPESIISFLEGEEYEDTVRNAVSLGGDTDTMGCIAGGIAEAYYGVPEDLKDQCLERVTEPMRDVLKRFKDVLQARDLRSAQ